ncbi:MAG TPA: class I SAM-dependent methyltransferase, partial [Thermoanaerobaculia bacterium]
MIASDGETLTARNLAHFESRLTVEAYSHEEGLRPLEEELIQEYFAPPPARILDLGCGTGRTTVGLVRRGYRTVGIDVSHALLAEGARLHPDLDLRFMDATDLELPDASFDGALFSFNGIDGIYPVAQRRRALAEVLRVLQPGGTFLLSS